MKHVVISLRRCWKHHVLDALCNVNSVGNWLTLSVVVLARDVGHGNTFRMLGEGPALKPDRTSFTMDSPKRKQAFCSVSGGAVQVMSSFCAGDGNACSKCILEEEAIGYQMLFGSEVTTWAVHINLRVQSWCGNGLANNGIGVNPEK